MCSRTSIVEPLTLSFCTIKECCKLDADYEPLLSKGRSGSVDLVLTELLYEAVRRNVIRNRSAILCSGGLDSSVLLKVASDLDLKPLAITVGLEGSSDFDSARRVASSLGIDHVEVVMDESKAIETVKYVTSALRVQNHMDVSLATLFFSAAKAAILHGRRLLVAGQGADELFGGYYKYLRYAASGGDVLAEVLRNDARSIWISSVRRDYAASAIGGCTLTFPYLDSVIYYFAIGMPPELKISSGDRKASLRRAASKIGLPEEVVKSQKKAAQYSSRLDKLVRRFVHQI